MIILTRASNVFIRSLTSTARRFLGPSIAALWPDDVALTNQNSVDYTCVTLSNDAEAETPSSHQIKRSSFASPICIQCVVANRSVVVGFVMGSVHFCD
jgi:hypothetical protein